MSVTEVTFDRGMVSIGIGASVQLNTTILPVDATDSSVSWASDNESIATVSSSGLVTGIAGGDALITVTTTDGSYTANCQVYVWANISPGSSSTYYPQVAMDDNGNAIIVWDQDVDDESEYEQILMIEYQGNE